MSNYGALLHMAGGLGLEPRMTVPKTAVLPLHHPPAGAAGQVRHGRSGAREACQIT